MNITWYYDEDGNEVLPVLQLVEPHRVTDVVANRLMRPNRTAGQEYLDWVLLSEQLDATPEEYHSLYREGGSLPVRILNSPDSEIKIKNNAGQEMRIYMTSGGSNKATWSSVTNNRISGGGLTFEFDGETYKRNTSQFTSNYVIGGGTNYVTYLIRDYTGAVSAMGAAGTSDVDDLKNNNNAILRSSYRGSPYTELTSDIWNSFPNSKDSPIIKEEGIVNIDNRFAPRTQTSGIGVYPLNRSQVEEFTKDLWTTTFVEALNELVNGDPMNSIVSLRWFYGIGNAIPRTEAETYVVLGNVPFNGALTETTLITRPASTELMTFSMGSIEVPRHYNNFLDLAPFTKLQLYIPYVGFVDLNTTEFMGKRLRLEYNINIVTGATIALVYVSTGENSWRTAAEFVTTMGVEIPLTVDAREHISTRIATTMAGLASTGLGMAAGSAMGPIGMAAGSAAGAQAGGMALSTFQNGFDSIANMSTGATSRNGGGVDNETGSLGDFTPHIILTRPQAIAPPEYNDIVGRPDHRKVRIENMNGYFKVGAFESRNYTTGQAGLGEGGIQREAMSEIEQILKAGVYVS